MREGASALLQMASEAPGEMASPNPLVPETVILAPLRQTVDRGRSKRNRPGTVKAKEGRKPGLYACKLTCWDRTKLFLGGNPVYCKHVWLRFQHVLFPSCWLSFSFEYSNIVNSQHIPKELKGECCSASTSRLRQNIFGNCTQP